MGTPKLCWEDQVKLEFEGDFGGQKAQKRKILKFLAIFGKTVDHKGLKFGKGAFLTRIYNFVFIKNVGCLDNNRKMPTNITTRTTRSPRPARLRRR